jgi:hypothetical protein
MAEYIEREAAIANRREYNLGGSYDNTELAVPVDAINSIPAADVRPVVRGKWIAEKEDVEWENSTVRYRCSHCKRLPHFDKETYKFILSDFCPKCGADMREES